MSALDELRKGHVPDRVEPPAEADMLWFRDAKLGMFMRFGLYSPPDGAASAFGSVNSAVGIGFDAGKGRIRDPDFGRSELHLKVNYYWRIDRMIDEIR